MSKIFSNNPGNNDQQSLNPCNDVPPLQNPLNSDPPVPFCDSDGSPNLNNLSQKPDVGFLDDICDEINGLGHQQNCDPMMSGSLRNDPDNPNRLVINRYSKALRACDEAMLDLFTGLEVLDINGQAKRVPIIYAAYERAVANLLQGNVRKDNSLVTDSIKLPTLAINRVNFDADEARYVYHWALDYMRDRRVDLKPGFTMQEARHPRDTVFGVARGLPINVNYELNGWCWYMEELDQLEEQVILKFSPVAYIDVRGVPWETIVKKTGQTDNVDTESGEKQRVVKFKFNFTVETYIPQPIVRKKAVLTQKIDILNTVNEIEVTEVLDRLEIAIKDLESEL
jgi:hypothetical protein